MRPAQGRGPHRHEPGAPRRDQFIELPGPVRRKPRHFRPPTRWTLFQHNDHIRWMTQRCRPSAGGDEQLHARRTSPVLAVDLRASRAWTRAPAGGGRPHRNLPHRALQRLRNRPRRRVLHRRQRRRPPRLRPLPPRAPADQGTKPQSGSAQKKQADAPSPMRAEGLDADGRPSPTTPARTPRPAKQTAKPKVETRQAPRAWPWLAPAAHRLGRRALHAGAPMLQETVRPPPPTTGSRTASARCACRSPRPAP